MRGLKYLLGKVNPDFYFALAILLVAALPGVWAYKMSVEPAPEPLVHEIYVPPSLMVEIDHNVSIHRATISISAQYADVTAGRYDQYPALIHWDNTRILKYLFKLGPGQFVEASRVLEGFGLNAFSASPRYADGKIILDPVRDYTLIVLMWLLSAVIAVFGLWIAITTALQYLPRRRAA